MECVVFRDANLNVSGSKAEGYQDILYGVGYNDRVRMSKVSRGDFRQFMKCDGFLPLWEKLPISQCLVNNKPWK